MKKLKKKKWILIPAVIVLVFTGMMVRGRFSKSEEPTIKTAKVERGLVTSTVSATGTLKPLTTVDVKSDVGGRVNQLMVDVGDTVKPGQLIAVIDPTDSQTAYNQAVADLQAASAKVSQARQGLQLQQAQTLTGVESAAQALRAAKLRLAQAQEQAHIQPSLTKSSIAQALANYNSAKASLAQLKSAGAPQRRAQAQSSYDQAKANYDNAAKDYKRQQELYAKEFVPKSQVDTAEAKYNVTKADLSSAKQKLDTIQDELNEDISTAQAKVAQMQAALDSARSNRVQDTLKKQDLEAARASVRQAEAALAAAKANSLQTQMKEGDIISARAQVERNKAQLQSTKTQLGYTRIVAPRQGVVLQKYVEVGSIINSGRSSFAGTGAGTSVVQIADTSRMFATVNVDETDIAQLDIGQNVDITVDAYSSELFEGKVTKIDPQAMMDQNVTTIAVTVEVDSPDIRLKPGMNVTCDFVIDKKEDALIVPNEAVKEKDDETIVTLVKGGQQIQRKIQVGIVGNEYSEVIDGLKEGDTVVTAVIQPESQTGQAGMGSSRAPMGGMGGGGMGGRGMGRF